MSNPSRRKKYGKRVIDVYDEPESETVAIGDYGYGHGVSLTLNIEYVAETSTDDIEDDIEALLEAGLKQVHKRIETAQDNDT